MKICTKCKLNEKQDGKSYCRPCFYKTYGKEHQKSYYTAKKGVYGIFEYGECLYIGESKRLNNRISKQKTINPNLSNHPAYIIGIIEECDNHLEKEKYYINQYKPKYNIQGV
tara:strand:+ start:521 stop:856 length:336 start_codon:yes stop_codon:yes gene_type:complete